MMMTTMMIISRTAPTPQHTAMMSTVGMPSSSASSAAVTKNHTDKTSRYTPCLKKVDDFFYNFGNS